MILNIRLILIIYGVLIKADIVARVQTQVCSKLAKLRNFKDLCCQYRWFFSFKNMCTQSLAAATAKECVDTQKGVLQSL